MIGVIFDCDGTLIDSEHAHFSAWKEALRKHGINLSQDEYSLFSGQPANISKKLYQKFRVSSAEAILNDKKEIYRELQKDEVRPIKVMVNFVKELAERKYLDKIRLGLASAATKEEIFLNLKILQLGDIFDAVVSGVDDLLDYNDPEGVNKPKPYIYQHAAKLLNLEPFDCIAFEDSNAGVVSSAKAGLTTVAVPNTFTEHHDFSLANFIIDTKAEIYLLDFFKKSILRSSQKKCF